MSPTWHVCYREPNRTSLVKIGDPRAGKLMLSDGCGGYVRNSVYHNPAAEKFEEMCECGKCLELGYSSGVLTSRVDGRTVLRIAQSVEGDAEFDKAEEAAEDSLDVVFLCLDRFPATLSLKLLSEMCRISMLTAALAVMQLGAQGHERASKICYAAAGDSGVKPIGKDPRRSKTPELLMPSEMIKAIFVKVAGRWYSRLDGRRAVFSQPGGDMLHVTFTDDCSDEGEQVEIDDNPNQVLGKNGRGRGRTQERQRSRP
ncbi:unnamed protein product [Chondrus crispus]|uniref:Uncharacterized protein n=1 Tax=Chondrus crispus TaxID=2769 RepID=R7QIM5_CHOCR|nr:unnamed protein product [Chondrus crispus]CDF37924.1 unnamed protein product [Chondrus crispus]|eukprot:XP_005717795.1 unnamed protein product [Chondrus crispus]